VLGDSSINIRASLILGRRNSSVWLSVDKMSQDPLRAGKSCGFSSFSALEGDLDPVVSAVRTVHHGSLIGCEVTASRERRIA
jgi:hypothetical protein